MTLNFTESVIKFRGVFTFSCKIGDRFVNEMQCIYIISNETIILVVRKYLTDLEKHISRYFEFMVVVTGKYTSKE